MIVSIIFVIFLLGSSRALEYHLGGCPSVTPLQVKTMHNLTGKWYEVMKYKSMFAKSECARFNVEMTSEKTISITITEKGGELVNTTRTGEIDASGALEFQFTFLKLNVKFHVLEADFEHFLVAFACKSALKLSNVQMAWIWSRERTLDQNHLDKAFAVLQRNKISTDDLKPSGGEHCY